MSRPAWAWRSCAPASAANNAPRPDKPRAKRGRSSTASSTTRILLLISASLIAVLATPATTLAHAKTGARTKTVVAHTSQQTNRHTGRHTDRHIDRRGVVLAFGAGYAAAHGSVRVRALQRELTAAGFSPGRVDGRYGPRTEQAVRRYQTASGLIVDGIAGPITQATISRSHSTLYPGAGENGPSSTRVQALQRGLIRAHINPGPVDGRYGPRTEQAVRRYQTTHGLDVTGIAKAATITHLHIPPTVPVTARRHAGPRAGRSRATRVIRSGATPVTTRGRGRPRAHHRPRRAPAKQSPLPEAGAGRRHHRRCSWSPWPCCWG